MSAETPAAHLARLKVSHPRWRIDRSGPGALARTFIAVERSTGRRIVTKTLGELEGRLIGQAGRDR